MRRRGGEEAVCVEQVGVVHIPRDRQAEAAKQVGKNGADGDHGQGVERLFGQHGRADDEGGKRDDGEILDGVGQNEILQNAHPGQRREVGHARDRRAQRGQGEGVKGIPQVNDRKHPEEDCGEDERCRVLCHKHPSASLLGRAQDERCPAAEFLGEHPREQEQNEAVQKPVKFLREHHLPAGVVHEVRVTPLGGELSDVRLLILDAHEQLLALLRVGVFVACGKVCRIVDEPGLVLLLCLLELGERRAEPLPLLEDVGRLLLGHLSLQAGHVLLVHAVVKGLVVDPGTARQEHLEENRGNNDQNVLVGYEILVQLRAHQRPTGQGDRHGGQTDALLFLVGDLVLPSRTRRAAEQPDRHDRANDHDRAVQDHGGGQVGRGVVEQIQRPIAGKRGIGVHDREAPHELDGAREARHIPRLHEVEHEVDPHDAESRDKGQRVLLDQRGEHHEQHPHGKQHEDLLGDREDEVFRNGQNGGA